MRVALAALALLVWLTPVGYRDLFETDEGRYAEISREMLASGDWVTPRLNDLKYFEKPALQYWATALAFKLFGIHELSARLWPALAGLFSLLAVWLTARRLWGSDSAFHAATVTGSMWWMLAGSQVGNLDMGLSFFLTLALCAFLTALDRRTAAPDRRLQMCLVWVAMAGAVLSKGLVGLVIPGAVLVLHSLWQRDWRLWPQLEWLRGGFLFLLLTLPWFVMVSQRNPEFVRFFFIHEHFERYLTTEHGREGPLHYFVPLLLAGTLPWTTLLPAALRWNYAQPGEDRPLRQLLLLWCGFVFLFFSVSGSKLQFYILPMFPALGLLLGRYLASSPPDALRTHAWLVSAFWMILAVAAPIVLLRQGSARTPAEHASAFAPWATNAAVAFSVLAAAAAMQAQRQRKRVSVLLLAAGSLIGLQTAAIGYQAYAPVRSLRHLAELAAPYTDERTPVFSVGDYDQTFSYYLQRTVTVVAFSGELAMGQKSEPEKWIADYTEFARRWRGLDRAVAIASVEVFEQMQSEGLPMTEIGRNPRRVLFRKP